MKRLVSISIGLLLLCGCAGRNPIEPPIPYADAGYSGGLKTLATIAAFYYDFGPITLRIDTLYHEGLVSLKVMKFSHLTTGQQNCFKRHKIKTNLVSIDRL